MTPRRFQESTERDHPPPHRWRLRWWGAFLTAFFVITLANASLWYGVHDLFRAKNLSPECFWAWRILHHFVQGLLCTLAGVSLVFQTWNTRQLPPPISFDVVQKDESDALEGRRRRAGLATWATPGTVGLALSGGGIRSATTSLGVLETLSTRKLAGQHVEALRAFDYLSSVSGGGWAAGAITAAFASGHAPGDRFAEIVARFRRASDYVIPGGVGLTRATLKPIILLTMGITMNVVVLIPFTIFAVLILYNMSSAGWLMTSLNDARRVLPLFDMLWTVGGCHGLFKHISALQIVALTTYLGLAAILIGLFVIFLAMLASPFPRAAGWLRGIGQSSAEIGLLTAVFAGILLLFLAGSSILTIIAVSGLAAAIVIRLLPRLDRSQRMKVIGAIFVSQGVLLGWEPHELIKSLTNAWVSPIHGLLSWPTTWAAKSLSPYSDRLFYAELWLMAAFALGFFVSRNDIGLHGFWTDRIRRAFLAPSNPTQPNFKSDSVHRFLRSRPRPLKEKVRQAAVSGNPVVGISPDANPRNIGRLLNLSLAAFRPRDTAKPEPPDDAYKLEAFPNARPANIGGFTLGAPIHIVNAAVNIPGSSDSRLRNRGTARFEFTPYFVGCHETGWTKTNRYGDSVTLPSTLAISAAAVNSQAGRLVNRGLGIAVAASNLSLGVWVRNPRLGRVGSEVGAEDDWLDPRFRRWGHFWVAYQLSDLLGRNDETDPLLFVSDGGHHDNLGLSALIDRRCEYIVCIDAGADPGYECEDLAQVLRMMQIDANWSFTFNISSSTYTADNCSFKAACAALRAGHGPLTIHAGHASSPNGLTILYHKAALPPNAPIAVEHYAAGHSDFPHETTADQFFDEAQFEAYLQLGRRMGTDVVKFLDRVASKARPLPEPGPAEAHPSTE